MEDYNAYKQLVEAELNSADFPVYVTCFTSPVFVSPVTS